MTRHDGDVVERLALLCDEAVATDGTNGVLLGCTCMSPIAEELQRRCGFPVLDASRCGLEAAFAAVREQRPEAGGPLTKESGLASEVVTAYLDGNAASARSFDDCEVCAVGSTPAEVPQ
jgi:allantoin racemase